MTLAAEWDTNMLTLIFFAFKVNTLNRYNFLPLKHSSINI